MNDHLFLFLLAAAFLLPSAGAQEAAASAPAAYSDPRPYEIVITPKITRLDLRNLIEQVEEDFFAKFNELNLDDEYDIFCYRYTPTMSHISKRLCEPAFIIRARGDMASQATFRLGSSSTIGSGGREAAFVLPPAGMRKEVKPEFDTLEKKMEELNASNPELRSIGNVLAELKWRLKNYSSQ